MTRRRIVLIVGVCVALAVVTFVIVSLVSNRAREGRRTTAQLEADLVTLRAERNRLRPHVLGALQMDPRLAGMPSREVLVGLPTSLAQDLVTAFITGVADQMTLHLSGIRVHKSGEVRRIVPLGDWELTVLLTRVTARLASGAPDVRFGDQSPQHLRADPCGVGYGFGRSQLPVGRTQYLRHGVRRHGTQGNRHWHRHPGDIPFDRRTAPLHH
jgi:hypothetical protein